MEQTQVQKFYHGECMKYIYTPLDFPEVLFLAPDVIILKTFGIFSRHFLFNWLLEKPSYYLWYTTMIPY